MKVTPDEAPGKVTPDLLAELPVVPTSQNDLEEEDELEPPEQQSSWVQAELQEFIETEMSLDTNRTRICFSFRSCYRLGETTSYGIEQTGREPCY